MITTHGVTHWNPDDCYGCKVQTLTIDRGGPKTHAKKGDHWKDNPVVDRIKELSGVEIQPPAERDNP